MAELRIIDDTGDSNVEWDINDLKSVEKAQKRFEKCLKDGYSAFSINKDGSQGKKLKDFDAKYEKVILFPPTQKG